MKNAGIYRIALLSGLLLVSLFASPVYAQGPGRGNGYGPGPGPGREDMPDRIPGLTEEQKSSIEKLRTAHFRDVEKMRAEIGEKEAHLNTLRVADNPDAKAIDRTIDEISQLRGNIMKAREAHRRDIRALLTDDQKAFFDARPGRGKFRNDDSDRPGRNDRPGRGNRQGRGYRGDCPYR